MTQHSAAPTAAVLLIGNELLSGRTQDTNLAYIAKKMVERGIRISECRVIPDISDVIVKALNELRERHTYVFTTGGIGPTHDDITADCVAEAFNVPLPINPEAEKMLLDYFSERGVEPNADRLRMARIPEGAVLVDNPVSIAPGFQMGNVFVFAGVPRIMQSMLDSVVDRLEQGPVVQSVTVFCTLGEGTIAAGLRDLQARFPNVDIGSYPGKMHEDSRLSLVARGTDATELAQVKTTLEELIRSLSVP